MEKEEFKEIDNFLNEKGVDFNTYLGYRVNNDRSFLKMPVDIKAKYDNSFDLLTSSFNTTKEKGDMLEQLVKYLTYNDDNVFELKRNIHTSTNEIDLFLTPTNKGKLIFNNYYRFVDEGILCECKNYDKKLGVTYVGKFASLLHLSGFKIGLIFTIKGLTGRNEWSDSKGLVKKIALKEDIFILDFTLDDYKKIKEDNDIFLDIVEKKYLSLKNDIEYTKYIQKHEAEDEIKKNSDV